MFRRLLLAAIILPLGSGCVAMRSDIYDLQDVMADMRADQDRLLREIRLQNEAILDSLRLQDIRLRGDFTNQLIQIERQLVTIQELTGQGQQRLAELRESIRATEEAMRRSQDVIVYSDTGAVITSDDDPQEVFAAAVGMVERGSLSTARLGFQEFVSSFPTHPRVPQARLYIGEILEEEDEIDEALEEYARIVDEHSASAEAPSAMLRIALIERLRGNDSSARSILNDITAAFPRSPEAEEARAELRRMR